MSIKIRSLRHPSTAPKHMKAQAAAQFCPLSEYDIEEIEALFSTTHQRDYARLNRERANREDLNPSEE